MTDAKQIAESANCSADVAGVVDRIKLAVVQDIYELPDYVSPDAQPNLLQCTVEELGIILERDLSAILTTLASGRDEVRGEPVAWMRWRERELHHGKDLEWQPLSAAERAAGWSEIPLYALLPQGDQP
jgi:hypothetical protein